MARSTRAPARKKPARKRKAAKKGGLTASVQRHDPKARPIMKIDDLAYVKESVLLLAASDLGLLDKNEKDTLTDALNLRNRCGHPSKYRPGVKKVSAFVEDVTSIVFA